MQFPGGDQADAAQAATSLGPDDEATHRAQSASELVVDEDPAGGRDGREATGSVDGDAEDVGDTMAAGDEATVLARLRRYRDAGVTDLAVRVVPLGEDASQRSESRRRTQSFVASLVSEFGR